ncbi:MAG: PASTA domain-containing protein [Solirubrobacterales bacterium]
MIERLRIFQVLVATTALLFAAVVAVSTEEAHALKCKPACIPPPEEELPGEEPPPPPPPPPPTRSVLVIGVGWQTPDPGTSSELENKNHTYVAYLNEHTNDFFSRQAAPAPWVRLRATNGGEYMIEAPRGIIPPGERERQCAGIQDEASSSPSAREFFDTLTSRAEAKARQQGFYPDGYDAVVFQYRNAGVQCVGGLSSGRRVYLTGLGRVVTHELGHYFGLGHAAFLRCQDPGGRPTPLGPACEQFAYGDPYSTMGSGSRAYNAIQANKLGWMNGQFFDVLAGDFTITRTIRQFTDPVRADRALRLRDGGATYWLEYRTPTGVDDPSFYGGIPSTAQSGLVIHREPTAGSSQLLDMTPGSKVQPTVFDDALDAPLPVGRSWEVPGGEMKITLNSLSTAGANVTIASRRVTVPSVRGLDPSRAQAIIAAAGLWSNGWSPVIDYTCGFLGVVADQQPFAGTRVLAGTEVRLGVGEPHPTFPCF